GRRRHGRAELGPSRRGRRMSRAISAGIPAAAAGSAGAPSSADETAKPSSLRNSVSITRVASSSATARTRGGLSGIAGYYAEPRPPLRACLTGADLGDVVGDGGRERV